jgi:two-component system, sensor histidine kinase YesM
MVGSSDNRGVIVMNILTGSIQKMLSQQVSHNQIVLVVDDKGQVLIQANMPPTFTKQINLRKIAGTRKQITTVSINQQKYTVAHIQSRKPGLTYISLIPQSVLFQVPIVLSKITIVLLVISFLIGLLITYLITKKNYTSLKNIVSIIKSAEQGKPLPDVSPFRVLDEYDFILQNIIQTFIEQSYLKIQLSERNYRLRFMEMLALQSQINPHFLYNTLENIYWKTVAISGRPNEASTMIEHLGDILRYALDEPQKQTVLLDTEFQYIETYLEIQKSRYVGKFDVIWAISERTKTVSVPKLLIQPLIENSIYHGIKEKQGKCAIKIKTSHTSSMITIHIIDTGIGMIQERKYELESMLINEHGENQPKDSSSNDSAGHIGLFNTNKRLKLSYGEEYGLRILSKYGWGTSVQIRIPIVESASTEKRFVS